MARPGIDAGTREIYEGQVFQVKGFRDFLMRGNVVDLAVAVVIGAAFTTIINAVVKGVINPIVGAFGSASLDHYSACLSSACDKAHPGIAIAWGSVLGATINFVITAAVVYFLMILPMKTYLERRKARLGIPEPAKEPTDVELLAEIRDLLASQQNGAAPAAAAAEANVPGPATGEASAS